MYLQKILKIRNYEISGILHLFILHIILGMENNQIVSLRTVSSFNF